jgi:hypothetical protein
MNEEVQLFLLMLIFLEIFELSWQRGSNFRDYIKNLFYFYKKGTILFILLHPTLYFIIFSQIFLQNYSILSIVLVMIKVFDLGFKISLMDKIFNNKDLSYFEPMIKQNYKIPLLWKSAGLIIYPSIFFFAFS